MRKTINIIGVLVTLLNQFHYAQGQLVPEDPELRTGKLSNGLTYFIRHNSNPKGQADFHLVVKVGSVQEEENQRGLAHFLEHMAFNGTKHFPERTLIGQLEKKGIKFGVNINASTSYEETTYKLTSIPVEREGMVDTVLLILHDWASGGITNAPKNIDAERGVVREEWRTRSTGQTRVLENDVFPLIYAGSVYANRIPMGRMEVINNFKPRELEDFYRKWYRPDLMAVIVVGDIDVDEMAAKIEQLFSTIPARIALPEQVDTEIPNNTEPIIAIASDQELFEISMDVYWKINSLPREQQASLQQYKTSLMHSAISNLLLNRFAEMQKNPDSPLGGVNVVVDKFYVAGSRQALNLHISTLDEDSTLAALQAGLKEMERVRRFGFTHDELEQYIEGARYLLEAEYKGRFNRQHFEYVLEYIAAFTKNKQVPDPEWKYRTGKKILVELCLDSVNRLAQELIRDENMVFVVTGPDKEEQMPSQKEILDVWNQVQQALLAPYIETVTTKADKLADLKPPVPGHIVKTQTQPFGFTEWTFSNGVKVQFKQVKNEDNLFLLWGYSPGGFSAVSDSTLTSAMAINGIINQEGSTDLEGGSMVNVQIYPYYEQITASTKNLKDIKTLFRMLYRKITSPQLSPVLLDYYVKQKKNDIKRRSSSPKGIYMDSLDAIMASGHFRAALSLDNPDCLAQVDFEKLAQVYKDRIGNASNFVFFIAGDISVDSIRKLAATWLGGLQTGKKKKLIDHGMYPPEGVVKKHFTTVREIPQSTITIGYTGKIPFTLENQIAMQCLTGILRMRYTDILREKESGTYIVGVDGDLLKFPSERFIFQVNFDTEPGKKDKLMALVYEEIEKIRREGPAGEDLKKVKAGLLKNHLERLQKKDTAYYWLSTAWWLHVYGIDESDYEDKIAALKPQTIQVFAERLFSQGNLIEVIMDPEN